MILGGQKWHNITTSVDSDPTIFYIFVGGNDFFHLIGQIDTGVKTIFSYFIANFFHVGLVDLILGAITILCFINAIVSMVYIYLQAKQKYGKVEKYTSNKKNDKCQGKSLKGICIKSTFTNTKTYGTVSKNIKTREKD